MDVADLVKRLNHVKGLIHGCESLSIATTDGFVLATTHEEARQGEFLAAVTSAVILTAARGLAPFKVGACRALDFRGDRQVLMTFLADVKAYLVCVQHPGAHAVNIDEPTLRAVTSSLPDVLHDKQTGGTSRFYLQRDQKCLIPIRNGMTVGRGEHCDLIVPAPAVDVEHLQFQVLANTVLVRDLDTAKGSKLNQKRFLGTVEIKPGDRLSLPRSKGFYVLGLNEQGKLYPDTTGLEKTQLTRRITKSRAAARATKKK